MLYPYIKKAVSTFPMVWFVVVFLFWHTIFNIMFIEGQGLFYFSLGVWLNKSNFPIHKKPSWFSHYISWLFFLGIGVIKTFMAFELDPADASTFFILYGLHDISVASGILAVWYGGDAVAQWLMQKKWFVWVTAFSFIIYALHVPLINYATRLAFIYWHNVPNYRLITYIVIPTAIFFICIGVGALLRAAFPKVYRIATGGRGF
jgi:peptidoglycan/LPS O-acetylase OafA/YrhL